MTNVNVLPLTALPPSLAAVLDKPLNANDERAAATAQRTDGYCNELIQLSLSDGNALMVKRARFDWVAARLRASRSAASLLRRRTGVLVPEHLDVEQDANGRAIEAYWRIPLPTLKEVWATLPDKRKPQALRSWGTLLRRVHKALPGAYGQLLSTSHEQQLEAALRSDLEERLRPALESAWPAALPALAALLSGIERLPALLSDRPAVLVHNDFHMGNVLCQERPRSIRCVGVIDLENAWAGPAESDVAQLQVLHGPAFGHSLPDDWYSHFMRGYGSTLDPELLRLFRVLHLLNLGYFAAESGWTEHVANLEADLIATTTALRADLQSK